MREAKNSNFDDVVAFQDRFQIPNGIYPVPPDTEWLIGRVEMFLEEITELLRAHRNSELDQVADALVDLVYFILGTAATLGLPWQALWEEVHSANMKKELQPSDQLGRRRNKLDVIKPEGWEPPDLVSVLLRHTP